MESRFLPTICLQCGKNPQVDGWEPRSLCAVAGKRFRLGSREASVHVIRYMGFSHDHPMLYTMQSIVRRTPWEGAVEPTTGLRAADFETTAVRGRRQQY